MRPIVVFKAALASTAIALLFSMAGVGQEPEADPGVEIVPFPEDQLLEYRIAPGDRLELSVFGVPELEQSFEVQPDGRMAIPGVDRIAVAGLSLEQAERRLARVLEAVGLVKSPQVALLLETLAPREVTITGGLNEPGAYPIVKYPTLLALLEATGARPKQGTAESVLLIREGDDGKVTRTAVDGIELLRTRNAALDVELRAGDVVLVRPRGRVQVYVLGAVEKPGPVAISGERPGVQKAIAGAGGATERAGLQKLSVIRTDNDGNTTAFRANLKAIAKGKIEDVVLQDQDTVYVPYWPSGDAPPKAVLTEAKRLSAPRVETESPIEDLQAAPATTQEPAELATDSKTPPAKIPSPNQPDKRRETMLALAANAVGRTTWLDRKPITYKEYSRFAKVPRYDPNIEEVTGVTYTEAVEYCGSRDKRLPTDEEWQRAALRPGFEITSIYEWTDAWYTKRTPGDETADSRFRILKGQHAVEPAELKRRYFLPPTSRSSVVGFRCALNQAKPEPPDS